MRPLRLLVSLSVVACAVAVFGGCADEPKDTPNLGPKVTTGCHAYCFTAAYDAPPSSVQCVDEKYAGCGTAQCADGGPPEVSACDGQTPVCPDGNAPSCIVKSTVSQ